MAGARSGYVPGGAMPTGMLGSIAQQHGSSLNQTVSGRQWVDDPSQGGDGFSFDPATGTTRMFRHNYAPAAAPPPPAAAAPQPPTQTLPAAPQPTSAQAPAPSAAPTAAPAPSSPAPAPQPGPAMAALQSRLDPINAGAGWEQVSTPGQTRPGLGQRLPFVPARASGIRY